MRTLLLAMIVLLGSSALAGRKNWICVLASSSRQQADAAAANFEQATTPDLKRELDPDNPDAAKTMVALVVFSGDQFKRPVLRGWQSAGIETVEEGTLGSKPLSGGYTSTYFVFKITARIERLRGLLGDNRILWAGTEAEREQAAAAYRERVK